MKRVTEEETTSVWTVKRLSGTSVHTLTESEEMSWPLDSTLGLPPKQFRWWTSSQWLKVQLMNYIPEEKALELRTEVKKCLQNAKKPKSNLGKEQRGALTKLRDDDLIVILPAGKENATVVMNKEDYARKMEEILNGDDYEVVKRDPTPKLEKKLNNMLKGLWEAGEINKIGYDRLSACGTWQFCLHNGEPCSFVTFLCVSVATHVTARGVHVITMKRRIWFGSVRG